MLRGWIDPRDADERKVRAECVAMLLVMADWMKVFFFSFFYPGRKENQNKTKIFSFLGGS
jgi:hypothetical protein